jgi:general stress protein CsbA
MDGKCHTVCDLVLNMASGKPAQISDSVYLGAVLTAILIYRNLLLDMHYLWLISLSVVCVHAQLMTVNRLINPKGFVDHLLKYFRSDTELRIMSKLLLLCHVLVGNCVMCILSSSL